jgi:hypothetical protein
MTNNSSENQPEPNTTAAMAAMAAKRSEKQQTERYTKALRRRLDYLEKRRKANNANNFDKAEIAALRWVANQQSDQPGAKQNTKIAVSYMKAAVVRQGAPDCAWIARETKSIQQKADELGARIAARFSDCGKKSATERQGLQQLLGYLSRHKVDYVVVPHFAMLSRDVNQMTALADKIRGYGAALVSPEGEESALDVYHTAAIIGGAREEIGGSEWPVCPVCHQKEAPGQGCVIDTVFCNGRSYDRVKAGDEALYADTDISDDVTCPGCNVSMGQLHHWGCEIEECPRCHKPIFGCDCDVEVLMKR